MLDGVEYEKVKEYAALLPDERQEKIARYRFDSDRLLSLAAGLLIRSVIGDSPIILNEHGKPYVEGFGRHFSVSHSGRCAAIAVDEDEIGLDVEQLAAEDRLKIAARFYHPEEQRFVEEAEDQPRAFTRVWTRKEAYLKQIGTGIATDLTAFSTLSGELNSRIASFDLDEYTLSVCAERAIDKDNIYFSDIELKDLV
jgi:4'-phosphopantetheinyl transferase